MNRAFRGLAAAVRAVSVAVTAAAVAALAACASAPAAVSDNLDSVTATTVTVMDSPVELITETPRGGVGDPFAYVAPFETDWMGERALYLWISAPQVNGSGTQPRVSCDGHPLELQTLSGDLAEFKLSRAPYKVPAPWSGQWYFRLPQVSLDCLGTAQGIAIETQDAQGEPERFSASGKALAALQAFVRR
jgi:hypothetical protein